jgi:hypothetical protein
MNGVGWSGIDRNQCSLLDGKGRDDRFSGQEGGRGGGAGIGAMRGGYIEVRDGRLHTNLTESPAKGGVSRIGEWLRCLEDGLQVDLGSGGLYVNTGQRSLNGEEALGQSCYAVGA